MNRNPTHTDSEARTGISGTPSPQAITRAQTKAINDLAREWGDYVGGFKQAQKVIQDAFCSGRQFEQALKSYGHN